jgi:phospholipase/lecithinase/hemolysin
MRAAFRGLVAGLALVGACSTASAFSNAYYFGDSLSDTGNIFSLTGGTVPASPYFNGRFSDGPVWVETLAAGLGLPASSTASLQGGNNHAFGGARTTGGSIPSLLAQVGSFTAAPGALDPLALYVVVAGGNDMRDARSAFPSMDAAGAAGRAAAASAATNNLRSALGLLAADGARYVLVANLPDLGATPEAVGLALVAPSSDATNQFNSLMGGVVGFGQGLGLQMSFLDLAGVAAAVRSDALNNGGAVYGITNVTTPCGAFTGSVGISCNASLFSDALHPSARAHQIVGLAAVAVVPEPQTVLLMALGLFCLSVRATRRVWPAR